MDKYKIRLSKTDSINSINKENFIDIDLKRTYKLAPNLNIAGDVDSYEVFENERNNCNNYRLILTINPYCTNVLFNIFTEITKNEGSGEDRGDNKLECITDKGEQTNADAKGFSLGLNEPTRLQMIMNTEYSKKSIGYEYHLGYDIFTNHVIRNTSFKMVNILSDNSVSSMSSGKSDEFCGTPYTQNTDDTCRLVFNTIGDFMRYSDGTVIQYRKREEVTSNPDSDLNKHLYQYDDLMTFEDSINNNLSEDNGWFGIINNSTTESKKKTDKTITGTTSKLKWDSLDISRVINNYENCEFIDMYPDRTLFSFTPRMNTFRKRMEYNWDIVLTYPYRSEYCHDIVTSRNGKTNGLKLMTVEKSLSTNGADIVMFRSYIKHGLQRGDFINIYVNGKRLSQSVRVANVGNMSEADDDNALYYFYSTDSVVLHEIDFENNDENTDYRFRRVASGYESEYYIRVFKKLPNLKNKREILTDEIARNKSEFDKYIYDDLNASVRDGNNTYMIDFNKEQYRLAFSRTVYNDESSQVTFTDTIDVEHLVDNLGRPLHEIYATFIKTNRGYDKWYGLQHDSEGNVYESTSRTDITNEEVEFSHCFGNVSSGFEFSNRQQDKLVVDEDNHPTLILKKSELGDIATLNELGINNAKPYETEITYRGSKANKDEFYGDIVEYSLIDCNEKVLQTISHRFNTAQRELPRDNTSFETFYYQEIDRDDYDQGDGMIVKNNAEETYVTTLGNELKIWQRPEGYFYHPHYQILLKEFGRLNQSAHYDMKIRSIKPVQTDGIYLSVTTTLSHGLFPEDIVYLCLDDTKNYKNDKWYKFAVSYTENRLTFVMHPYNKTWKELYSEIAKDTGTAATSWNWLNIAEMIQSGNIYKDNSEQEITYNVKLRRRNINIPIYASKINHNKFLWRDMYRRGEFMDSTYEEYPYTNDAFYVNKEINFFLKRQDPHGYSGLYCDTAFPNDVEGNKRPSDNYFYKEEDEVVC